MARVCNKCGRAEPDVKFYASQRSSRCVQCTIARSKERVKNFTPAQREEYNRRYRERYKYKRARPLHKRQAQLPQEIIPVTPEDKFFECMEFVFAREGGYVDHPLDKGGPTNLGITFSTFCRWRGKLNVKAGSTLAMQLLHDLRHLTKVEASSIYHEYYWRPVMGEHVRMSIALMLFDFGVNSGVTTAVRNLQHVVKTKADGIMGPITAGKVNTVDLPTLISAYAGQRMSYLRALNDWNVWGKGWTNRVNLVVDQAKAWQNRG